MSLKGSSSDKKIKVDVDIPRLLQSSCLIETGGTINLQLISIFIKASTQQGAIIVYF